MNSTKAERFVPALRFRALTRFYDRLLRAAMRDEGFKRLFVEQVAVQAGHRVLDLGCGTGTLTLMLKRSCPDAMIVGLDGDPEVLALARRKAQAEGLDIEFLEGKADALPFEMHSFDRIVSSLVFHHLTGATKRRSLSRVRETLRAGGELHIADWGKAGNALMRFAFLGVQLLDGFETTSDNVKGRLPELMREAGFDSVEETRRASTLFGTLAFYRAVSPWPTTMADAPTASV